LDKSEEENVKFQLLESKLTSLTEQLRFSTIEIYKLSSENTQLTSEMSQIKKCSNDFKEKNYELIQKIE
jgi:hypothetical protein